MCCLVPQSFAHVCVGAALNVLDVRDAEAARQDEGDQLVSLRFRLPPPVYVYCLGGGIVCHKFSEVSAPVHLL